MNSPQPLRVGLYARVSSDQQAQQHTIASQIQALQQRIAADGLTCPPPWQFLDEGYSGSSLLRPALERVRDLAAAGGLDRLYVLSPDRLARRYAHQFILLEELARCDVQVFFLNGPIDGSPEQTLLLQVQGMVAEYERAQILERSRRGKRHAARRGSINALAAAPYGYRYLPKAQAGGQAAYQIVLEQARWVRQIFEWVGQDRLSLAEVSRRLAAAAVRSPQDRSRWNRTSLWSLLRNPAYKGMAAFGKTRSQERRPRRLRAARGQPAQPRQLHSRQASPPQDWIGIPVPALVSEDLFAAAAEQLEHNRLRQRRQQQGQRYLLAGLTVCGVCGYALCGRRTGRQKQYAYYRCLGSDNNRFGGQRVCRNRAVRVEPLEEAVWQDVCALLREPQRIEQEYQRRRQMPEDEVLAEAERTLAAEIRRVQRGIDRLIDAYQEGLLELPEFERRLQPARQRAERLRAEVQARQQQQTQAEQLRLVIGHLETFASRIQEGLQAADWQTRRDVIRALVKQIEVDPQEVRVVYRLAPAPFAESPQQRFLHYCWGLGAGGSE